MARSALGHTIAGLLAGIGGVVLAAGPVRAETSAGLEAFVSGFAMQCTPITVHDSVQTLTLPSNYGASSDNSGYGGLITAQVLDFGLGGPAYLSMSPQLSVPAYTSAPGPLIIELAETGLSIPGINLFTFDPEFTGIFHSHDDTATYSLYYDPTDTAFGTTDLLYTVTDTPDGMFPYNFAERSLATVGIGVPYSVTETITFSGPSSSGGTPLGPTLDGSVEDAAMHAPSPLTWLVPGLLLLGWVRSRSRAQA